MSERQAFWDERYAEDGWVFGVEPNHFVSEFLVDLEPQRVLDLGCGQGRNALWLALQGHEVTGLDLSAVAIEQAKTLAKEAGVAVRFAVADLTLWRGDDESFDLVVLSYLQVAPEHRRAIHRTVCDVLAPGGTVFLIAHHADNLTRGVGGPQRPEVLFSEDQLEEDFSGFDILRLGPIERLVELDEEPATAIDIILIARKPV